jgi:transcriptional regulator with XRE-family HTH domain
MSTPYSTLLKKLRAEKGLSQQQLAERLSIARTSYVALEQGRRELSLGEAENLADFYGISIADLVGGAVPNSEKYKHMLFAFLRAEVSGDGKIPKTKLAKLLYLADFAWYYEHFASMSGMPYRKIQYGPVPDAYFRIVDELYEEGKITIDTKTTDGAMLISQSASGVREPIDTLNNKEQKLIVAIAKKWKHKRTQEIVDFAHNQLPYKVCSEGEIIPYELITQEDPEYVY